MMKYRYRAPQVEAMHMDGTPERARAIISWLATVTPELVIRQRVEYLGWNDQIGHVELEMQHHDEQCGMTDWVVVEQRASRNGIRIFEESEFHRYFELDQD